MGHWLAFDAFYLLDYLLGLEVSAKVIIIFISCVEINDYYVKVDFVPKKKLNINKNSITIVKTKSKMHLNKKKTKNIATMLIFKYWDLKTERFLAQGVNSNLCLGVVPRI